MIDKKYELTGTSRVNMYGVTVHQIRATVKRWSRNWNKENPDV